MRFEEITDLIIGAAIEVHRALGPGLPESTYRKCLCRELQPRNVPFECELPAPVEYKGEELECGYRIDVLVAGQITVELKAVEALAPIHEAQLLTYLRLSGKQIGLLINFNVSLLKDGIKRRVLNLKE